MLALTLILWAWGGGEAVKAIVIAWIVAGAWATGINIVGQEVGWARVMGILQMFIASPVTPRSYLLGILLGHEVAIMPVNLALVTLVAYTLNSLELVPAAIVAGLLLTPVSTLLGLAIAMRIRKPTNISAITNPISTLFILLPPVFYPMTIIPEPLRPILLAIPTTAAAELARAIANYHNVYTINEPLVTLIAWSIIAIAVAKQAVKWGHE